MREAKDIAKAQIARDIGVSRKQSTGHALMGHAKWQQVEISTVSPIFQHNTADFYNYFTHDVIPLLAQNPFDSHPTE